MAGRVAQNAFEEAREIIGIVEANLESDLGDRQLGGLPCPCLGIAYVHPVCGRSRFADDRSAGGYVSAAGVTTQSAEAIATIYNLFVYGVAAIGIGVVILILLYHLDREYPQIIKELLEREQAKKAALQN